MGSVFSNREDKWRILAGVPGNTIHTKLQKMMSSLIKIYCLYSPYLFIVPQALLLEWAN